MRHDIQNTNGNVLIRQLDVDDIEKIRNWRNNPNNTKYLRQIPYITQDMQRAWYEKYLDDKDEMIFAIVENNELHRVVGSMALYNFDEKKVEFGKILIGDEKAHGKQVGFHALLAIVQVAFNELGIEQIYLHVYDGNIAAKKVYEKVGFVKQYSHEENGMEELVMVLDKVTFCRRQENA